MRSGADVLGLQQTAAKKKSVLPRAPGPEAAAQTPTTCSRLRWIRSVGLHDGYRETGRA